MPDSEHILAFINVPLVSGRQRNTLSIDPMTSSTTSTQMMLKSVAQVQCHSFNCLLHMFT